MRVLLKAVSANIYFCVYLYGLLSNCVSNHLLLILGNRVSNSSNTRSDTKSSIVRLSVDLHSIPRQQLLRNVETSQFKRPNVAQDRKDDLPANGEVPHREARDGNHISILVLP